LKSGVSGRDPALRFVVPALRRTNVRLAPRDSRALADGLILAFSLEAISKCI
jgi:hypothetical protein